MLLCFIINTVSSAYNLTAKLVFSGRPFMYNKNNSGPRMEPLGNLEQKNLRITKVEILVKTLFVLTSLLILQIQSFRYNS